MLRLLGLTLVLALPMTIGCAAFTGHAEGLRVWAVPDTVTVFQDAVPEPENDIFSEANRLIRLEGAVNEVISFQLVLSSGVKSAGINSPGPAANVGGITFDDLRQGDRSISSEHVQMYRQGWVPVSDYPAWYLRLTPYLREPRLFPDPLIPLSAPRGALPIVLEPNKCEAVWVEIRVPPGTEPGIYRSMLHLTPRNGPRQDLNVSLDIWPFAVPQTRHLALMAGLDSAAILRQHLEVKGRPYSPSRLSFDDPAYQQAAVLIDQTIRLLHEHRCSAMLRDVHPLRRIGVGGLPELDWADYDRLVAGVLDGSAFEDRAAAVAWPLPIDEREPSPAAYGGWGSPAYDQMLISYLRQCVAHFAERGWLDRHFMWMPAPGDSRGEQYRQFEHLGRVVRQADTRINLVCNLTPQSMAPYGWRDDPFIDVASLVGTWCAPASMLDPDELAHQRKAGKQTWLWPDQPPYAGSLSLIAPPTHIRSLPWEAYRYELGGIMLPAVNDWPEDGSVHGPDSERALIWPGKEYGLSGPIPSIRLKRLLRGAQDYEYLWLLEHNNRPAIAKVVSGDLFAYGGTACFGEHFLDSRPGGWAADPAAWTLARRLMARELTAAIQEGEKASPPAPGSVGAFEQQIEWARLTQAVRRMRCTVEGIRVQMDEKDKTAPLQIEATLSLFNATKESANGTVALAPLPDGWTAGPAAATIAKLEPLHSTRRIVRAKTATIAANGDGVMPVQASFKAQSGEAVSVPGRLCVLTAQRLTRSMTIDGKLDDWPLGTNNVAGDFVLVGALDVPKQHRSSPDRPSQATMVFICDDRDYLYIAFNCEDDRLSERRIPRNNTVAYDGLWPAGEDLVEVILDPSGRAAEPGDVLHVVLKANGSVIAEHGAPCLGRVRTNSDWPAGIIAAIDDRSQPNRWTAEIRIPIASLGQRAAIWGVNFARYRAATGEYASWSGARQYLYSPVALGNMRLESPEHDRAR